VCLISISWNERVDERLISAVKNGVLLFVRLYGSATVEKQGKRIRI
jgi:hypothetical protein